MLETVERVGDNLVVVMVLASVAERLLPLRQFGEITSRQNLRDAVRRFRSRFHAVS